MGCSSNPTMLYNLAHLVRSSRDLDSLSRPFSTLEIDEITKHIPSDKAPGVQMASLGSF